MYRILSLDGGGVRGIVPAMVLAELERLAKCRVADMFDLVAATSTGAIVGLALLRPDGKQPANTADEVAEFYENTSSEVFDPSLWQRIRSGFNLLGPKHSEKALERRLSGEFGDTMLSQAMVEMLITSYDLKARQPHLFKSVRIPEEQSDQRMRVVARATSAAPTYFRPVRLTDRGRERTLVDGGVVANNPAMCAFAHALRRFQDPDDELPEEDVAMVSIGTGAIGFPFDSRAIVNGGILRWAKPLFDVVLDAQEDAVDYQMQRLLPPGERYFRLQANLSQEDEHGNRTKVNEIDNADPTNIDQLKKDTRALIDASEQRLTEIAELFCPTQAASS